MDPSTYNSELSLAYAGAAAGALVFYEYGITLSQEVHCIWRRRFSITTFLFLLNRYAMLAKAIVIVYSSWQSSLTSCRNAEKWLIVFDISSNFGVAAFSALRIWAIWGREWRPFLLVVLIAVTSPSLNTYQDLRTRTILNDGPFLPLPLSGCDLQSKIPQHILYRLSELTCSMIIATHGIVLAMTWLKTYGIYKATRRTGMTPTLTILLLRDGTFCYMVLFALTVLSLIFNKFEPGRNPSLLTVYKILPCILVSRFILNLRQLLLPGQDSHESEPEDKLISSVRFAPLIFGNLGAPIEFRTAAVPGETNVAASTWSSVSSITNDCQLSDAQIAALITAEGPLAAGLIEDITTGFRNSINCEAFRSDIVATTSSPV